MKTLYVEQLEAGTELFDQPFLMLDVNQRKTRDGRPYILFNLGDKTGRVGGVYWNVPSEVLESCTQGDLVLVTGDIRLYNRRLQVVALDLQPYDSASMADFVPSTERNQDEMISELRQVVEVMRSPLRQLVTELLLDSSFLRRYAEAPAAKMMHHAFVGGLLEHALAMVRFCRLAAEIYPRVDQDLLIAGALLHDVGKVHAYEISATFPITDEERLVGHITRGTMMVESAMDKIPDFDRKLGQQLVHLLLSHHGKPEWGSPVKPCTLEAILLHQIDLLDSRVQGFIDHVTSEPGDSEWTSRSLMFGYELMRKVK